MRKINLIINCIKGREADTHVYYFRGNEYVNTWGFLTHVFPYFNASNNYKILTDTC